MDFIEDSDVPENFHSGYTALVGRPNVGKSTLLNEILGQKISIVTQKPQTTRHRVLGIRSQEDAQIIFLDTPGIIDPRYGLHRAMMHNVRWALDDADLVVLLVDARSERPDDYVLGYLEDRPTILGVNKMDLVDRDRGRSLAELYRERHSFEDVVLLSGRTGRNVPALVEHIVDRLPPGPPLYPPDLVSEHPERFFVAEIVREKIFQRFREEIPYSTQVNIVAFEENEGRKDFIDAEIVVERASQKGILIGKSGRAIKAVGAEAREDVERFLQRDVYLQLHVKVEEDWRNRRRFLESYGLSRRSSSTGF